METTICKVLSKSKNIDIKLYKTKLTKFLTTKLCSSESCLRLHTGNDTFSLLLTPSIRGLSLT